MIGGATIRAASGGITRRRLQTTVVALVVCVSTASTVVALALVVNSNAPFDHAFASQHGADIVATIDTSKVSAAGLRPDRAPRRRDRGRRPVPRRRS